MGTIAGTAATLVGSVVLATQDKKEGGAWTLSAGTGLIGLSQLVGVLLGQENGNKAKETAQKIEFTRRAYDDLSARIDMVKATRDTTQQFQEKIAQFQARYNTLSNFRTSTEVATKNAPNTTTLQKRALVELTSQYTNFILIVAQIDTVLNSYEVLVNKYDKDYPIPRVQKDMEVIRRQLAEARDNYRKNVRSYLDLSGKVNAVFLVE